MLCGLANVGIYWEMKRFFLVLLGRFCLVFLSREVLWCTVMDAVESALNIRLSSLGGFSKETK